MGKKMAEERRKAQAAANPVPSPAAQEAPATGELNIKFNKNGTITNVKMKADEMIANLLNEYFVKSGTTNGTFKFQGQVLAPTDVSSLAEKGLKNNSEIIVS